MYMATFASEVGQTEGLAAHFTFWTLGSVSAWSLPQSKLLALMDLLRSTMFASKLSFYELQVFTGHLNFTCRVVDPCCTSFTHFCDTMVGLMLPHHKLGFPMICTITCSSSWTSWPNLKGYYFGQLNNYSRLKWSTKDAVGKLTLVSISGCTGAQLPGLLSRSPLGS